MLSSPNKYTYIRISLFIAGWILFVFPSLSYAQIMTHPLFMQIKAPNLESHSGISVDGLTKTYYIDSAGKDSIDISFYIIVPQEMLSEKWAISLTPNIISKHSNGVLKDIVVKGWKFAENQESAYEKYNEYVESIIDSSMYEKTYIDQKKLEQDIEHQHDQYWQFYYDEWERQIEYEIWKAKQDGSIKTFFASDSQDYKDQLYQQYLLRIENQSKRYLKANMDTTGLHEKYMKEFEKHNAKMPRFFVDKNIPLKSIPKKFKDIYMSKRTLNDITESMLELLVKRDSALMSLPVFDYQRIIENEKRTIFQDDVFDDIVKLPKNENALLDTTIYEINSDYKYLYTYTYASSLNDTIKVKLESKVLATDRSGFSTSAEDVLTYIISSPLEKEKNQASKNTEKIIYTPTATAFVDVEVKEEEITEEKVKKKSKKEKEEEFLKQLSEKLKLIGGESIKESDIDLEMEEVETHENTKLPKRTPGTRIQIIEE